MSQEQVQFSEDENHDSKATVEESFLDGQNHEDSLSILEGENVQLKEELNELKAKYQQIESRNSQLLRVAADFENYKRRQEKERENLIKFAGERIILSFLEVLDNFERAIHIDVHPEDFGQYVEGVKMIDKQFNEVLQKSGVTEIEAENQLFNPEFHQAVMRETSDEYPDQTIIQEFQKGYLLNGKVIRPSTVKVSVSP